MTTYNKESLTDNKASRCTFEGLCQLHLVGRRRYLSEFLMAYSTQAAQREGPRQSKG